MEKQSQNPMAVEPIPRLMARIGTPIVLSMLLQAAYNVVDSAYLARMADGGEAALTALSLAFPVQLFMVAVSIGTGVGTNALLARLLGQGDREQANRTVGNAQFIALCITVVFMLFAAVGVRPYVYSQSAGGSIGRDILESAIAYLHICCGVPVGIVMFSVYEKVLQATGRSLYSTIAQITGAVVNIVVDPVLIYGIFGLPAMGVRGAAWATVLGQLVSMGLGLLFHLHFNKEISNSFRYWRPSRSHLRHRSARHHFPGAADRYDLRAQFDSGRYPAGGPERRDRVRPVLQDPAAYHFRSVRCARRNYAHCIV